MPRASQTLASNHQNRPGMTPNSLRWNRADVRAELVGGGPPLQQRQDSDHFEALSSGDWELARELLPFMTKHKDDLKDIGTVSGAWTVFWEFYMILLAGMAGSYL